MAFCITKVKVRNFRSIESLTFDPSMLCAVVGENNAGKSNVLEAINRLIGPRWPSVQGWPTSDFYMSNPESPIEIGITLKQDPRTISFTLAPDREGEYRLLEDGSYVRRDAREAFPFVLIPAHRPLQSQMAYNRWNPLGRLLQSIDARFRADETLVDKFNSEIATIHETLASIPDFQEFQNLVRAKSAALLRRRPEDLSVGFELTDPWNFYRTLQIIVSEDGYQYQAVEGGAGIQSVITIAILQAFAAIQHSDVVLGVEEPETYLHPSAQRHFYKVLEQIARSGTQVIFTTHSPAFLDLANFDDIVSIRRERGRIGMCSRAWQVPATRLVTRISEMCPQLAKSINVASLRARLFHHSEPRRTEGFLAKMIVLVEGETEYVSLPVIARTCGCNFDELGIVVVPADGKTVMPLLLALYDSFNIPWYIVFDTDEAQSDSQSQINLALQTAAGIDDPQDFPPTFVGERIAAVQYNFDIQLAEDLGSAWESLSNEVNSELGLRGGSNKAIRAKAVIERFADDIFSETPEFWKNLTKAIRDKYDAHYVPEAADDSTPEVDEEIPF